jgi:glycine cleavage system protein P-like pyridoxal-binding family
MLTNPSTLGVFEHKITEVARIVHEAGGLLYYDGANLNAILGKVRPGDMGFDVIHMNLHKTFSTPHGGGGPGSGAVGVGPRLLPFCRFRWSARKRAAIAGWPSAICRIPSAACPGSWAMPASTCAPISTCGCWAARAWCAWPNSPRSMRTI